MVIKPKPTTAENPNKSTRAREDNKRPLGVCARCRCASSSFSLKVAAVQAGRPFACSRTFSTARGPPTEPKLERIMPRGRLELNSLRTGHSFTFNPTIFRASCCRPRKSDEEKKRARLSTEEGKCVQVDGRCADRHWRFSFLLHFPSCPSSAALIFG